MKIAGGTYRELCREPVCNDLYGSGVRAAFALSGISHPPTLVTVATNADADLATTMGISLEFKERSETIVFEYDTPISRPACSFNRPESVTIPLEVEADTVLAFGMVDGHIRIEAECLVIDPQTPGLTRLEDHFSWHTERLAIVGNHREIAGLAGEPLTSVSKAARVVRDKYKADVVIAKCGPRGAILVDHTGQSEIRPHPSENVFPIGSGDVFSAVFAWSWALEGNSTSTAAEAASLGTAAWCSRGPAQVVKGDAEILPIRKPGPATSVRDVRIYLAGPFFDHGQRWLVDLLRQSLTDMGIGVFSPFHDVGLGKPKAVAPADLEGLHRCDAVLALLDGSDAGTLFEVGYACAKGIPVVGFAENPSNSDLTMLIGTDIPVFSRLAQAAYHAAWAGLR